MKEPRYFIPTNCIEHRHAPNGVIMPVPRPTEDGKWPWTHVRICSGESAEYEIVIYQEGWGYIPVNGSGAKVRSEIPETKGKPIHCLTQFERDEFMRQYFPTTWEYEVEQMVKSMNSAAI